MVPTFSALPVEVTASATLRNCSLGVPQICSTVSGVYRLRWCRRSWKTQRGFCRVSSTWYALVFGSAWYCQAFLSYSPLPWSKPANSPSLNWYLSLITYGALVCSFTYSSWKRFFSIAYRMMPLRNAMSVPARICAKMSDTAAVRVKRGSTQTIFAFRVFFASIAHLNPQGWFSAGFPPITNTTSAFLMSVQPLVIAPRPNVAAKLATVGPCQTLAWVSRYGMPRPAMALSMRKLNSLVSVQPPMIPMPGARFTTSPFAFLATNVRSRVSFTCRAISLIAWSQEMRSHVSEPGRLTCGTVRRLGLTMSSRSVMPLGQSVPRLMGWSGSPSTCTTLGFTFFDLSPSVWMITPQETEQYGQVLLVSVVRAIFNSRISARACLRSNPSATAPPTAAAEPFRKVLRFTGWLLVVEIARSLLRDGPACQHGGKSPVTAHRRRRGASAGLSKKGLESYRRNTHQAALRPSDYPLTAPTVNPEMKRSTNKL